MKVFHLPDLGEGLADAEIREWYVKEGDNIKLDDLLVSVETAKAVVDVPSPVTGRIKTLFGKAGDVLPTGAPLVEYEVAGEANITEPERPKSTTVAGTIEEGTTVLREAATGVVAASTAPHIKALPAVRALAKSLGIELTSLRGSGPDGSITMNDVEQAHQHKSASTSTKATIPQPSNAEPLHGVRRVMSQIMTESHRQVADVTLCDDVDIQHWSAETDFTARIIHAIVNACQQVPALNAWYYDNPPARVLHKDIHIGIAVDSIEGLFLPVLKNAQTLSPAEIRTKINTFKQQIANRSIAQDDLHGATILLSNFGTLAGRYANPLVMPPTVAILGTGRWYSTAVAVGNSIEMHRMLPLSLTLDHRAVTGGEAARFLQACMQALQE
jgi:2-oxoisovalerate dehydrogenase E2 component (dihydrolipoyl transacylase)